jgi:hypothetical protein
MRVLHVTERHDFSSGGLTSALNSLMAGMLDTAGRAPTENTAISWRWKGPADFGFGHAAYEGA